MLSLVFSCLFITLGLFSFGDTRHNHIINDINKEYQVINVKVPPVIWNQALNPTPVLKSPVTITVPIHVQNEEDNEVEDDIESEITQVSDATISNNNGVQSVIQEPVLASTAAPAVTQAPVLQDVVTEETAQEVTGQVITFPCSCVTGQCGCCTGAILERFKMNACGNISFIPEDFVFDVRLSINNNTVVRRRVSASDPPPICFNPRRAPFVRICAELSNIRIRSGNAFACLDIEADIAEFPVYSASFRCFSLGSSGVQTGLKPKPISSGPSTVDLFGGGSTSNEAEDGEGLFGRPGGLFGGVAPDQGPLDVLEDAVGELFDGRSKA